MNLSNNVIKFGAPEQAATPSDPFISETEGFIRELKERNRGRIQHYKVELINMRNRSNISHSGKGQSNNFVGIKKEMDKIVNKINKVNPDFRQYELLKSYLYFYQRKLSLNSSSKVSEELIDQKIFNILNDKH